ncbi:MAG TPA: MFS transporter [Nitrososphaeraceae archaeon]|nr:MFS transporter [Nitrososphaeraceae archaeon]
MRFRNDKEGKNKQSNPIKLGLRPNIQQFLILVLVNAFVGAMIGLEQTVVPLVGKVEFGIESSAIIVSFIASFGAVKAVINLLAGNLSDKWGRKNVLVLGWLFAVPVPIILLFAPNWDWIIFANILLGVNQGLAWSMTVNMKIDLVGKSQRGLALGLNEFAGYVAVAVIGFSTGYLASTFGLKPYPFYIGIIFAILGLAISWIIVKDTRKFTSLEINEDASESLKEEINVNDLSFKEVFLQTSWKNRTLLAISQAGLINNLIFGVTWGLFTLYFASFAIGISEIGFLKALHPGIWGVLQLLTGTLSDKVGRKILIYPGMIIQGIGVWVVLFINFYWGWIAGMALLGIGTALVYPTLLAAISDVANPKWRATSLGVYRFWRDLGFVFGAIGIGFLADIFGLNIAFHLVALLGIASGIFVLMVMKETSRQG